MSEKAPLLSNPKEADYGVARKRSYRNLCIIFLAAIVIVVLIWHPWTPRYSHSHEKDAIYQEKLRNQSIGLDMKSPLSLQPAPFAVKKHPLVPKLISSDLKGPTPTNEWWTNFLISDSIGQHPGEAEVTVMPYTVKSMPHGLQVSYGNTRREASAEKVQEYFNADVMFTTTSPFQSRQVVNYDPLSVELAFSSSKQNETTPITDIAMRSYLVRGSPYITVKYENSIPEVQFNGTIREVNALPVDTTKPIVGSRTTFEVEVQGGRQTWALYSSSELSFSLSPGENSTVPDVIRANKAFNGTLRAALLPARVHSNDASAQTIIKLIDFHSKAYPVSSSIDYKVVEDNVGEISFMWESEGEGDLLMLASPHHVSTLTSGNTVLPDITGFKTLKGELSFVVGNSWIMHEPLSTASFFSPRAPQPEHVDDILDALQNDSTNFQPTQLDPYFFGKEVTRQARLVLIADQMNQTEMRETILDQVEYWLTPWLTGSNSDEFVYDQVWGGLCSKNGLKGIFFMSDFGNGFYNDHHFHYGYLIYSLAVLGRYRPHILLDHEEAIFSIVRDIANPTEEDSYFPLARHFSFFDSHSFASGVFVLDGGKSQESVSEAINAYYAVALLGNAMQRPSLENFGRILMSMEMRAARTYWQMPVESHIYEDVYKRNRMTGMVGSTKAVYTTWFGPLLENMHLINVIPFTPITEEFVSKDFVAQEYPVLVKGGFNRKQPPMMEIWKGYGYLAHAIINATGAWNETQDLITHYDDGNSETNSLFWIATRP